MAAISGTLKEKAEQLRELVGRTDASVIADYNYRLDMSWIHHDSAIEGVVYEPSELVAAINEGVVSDSTLIPVYDEIRQHKAAIDLMRSMIDVPELVIDLEVIKQLYTTLAPDELEGKGPPRYRKEIPLHRLYFHEIAKPDKIGYRMRQMVQWINDDENRRTMSTVRYASRVHHELLQIFPFPKHSGKVARLVMNLILMREGFPPVILHATDRQRYYDALKTSHDAVAAVVTEALHNSLDSTLRFFHKVHGIRETA